MLNYLHNIFTIVLKDLRMEIRTKEITPTMLVFSLIIIVIFSFTFDPGSKTLVEIAPGVLWVSFSFASMLGFSRSFSSEQEQGAIKGLLIAPVDRSAIYLGKFLSNTIFVLMIEIVALIGFGIFYNIDVFSIFPKLFIVLIIATLGISAVGTLYAALTSNIRMKEILLPILLFPITVPVLIGAVKITGTILNKNPLTQAGNWIKLLGAYDIIFILIGMVTFEYVIGD